ncbi:MULTISPECIES: putative entry exclusion protein TrbK-alt [Pseudomonadota]|uniref:Conjugal transfer protein TrbK n=2 Tax=Pseudomonadota TaxID=1224 RepID=A0A2T5PK91_ECTOL|nr:MULTISPECIES: putative entry exclusion protein TrbK-alt [Pseudomonadota]HBO2099905.1 putative entry exclusion protein TrbK-alt [Pseudomonas aeruginosa]MCF5507350.1 putative entry exclusion protein TrbK-alt [Pseudomonas sp. PA-3-6H]MCF5514839.1 putative entry exclusion protein TrbK-alt [Pseudomonas sp. PA-3-6E]MCF5562581.1 putative entry exclusion protein TrbK-alt [Pseudomonas sp. PA-3-5D]MCF5591481.1 putative entry exclusion protein TrbK-alt [Pseudomonas sp. PA-3-10C]|tara:strand:- start:15232 stop:15507 length:276 start_codon:yes stop_codon:yes gene_type:complete
MKLTAETTLKAIAIALGAIAALMAAMELQRALEVERMERPAVVSDDPLRETLQHCRSLTPEALEADTECQAAWEENRRRFFGTSTDNSDPE